MMKDIAYCFKIINLLKSKESERKVNSSDKINRYFFLLLKEIELI